MNQFPNLLSPLKIGKTEVRNRILVSAHVPGFADNNIPGESTLLIIVNMLEVALVYK